MNSNASVALDFYSTNEHTNAGVLKGYVRSAMTAGIRPTLWIALLTLGLAYSLLGWQLSAYPIFWSIGSLVAVLIFTVLFMWGGTIAGRMMRIGPRSVVTMLILSSTITLAVAASTLFTVLLILLATQVLTRLELQTAGFNRWLTLAILACVSSTTLTGGWLIGYKFYPSNPLWLNWHSLPSLFWS